MVRFRRWRALRPRDGPGGNPSVVLAQLEGVAAQLEELQAAAAKHAAVSYCPASAVRLQIIGIWVPW